MILKIWKNESLVPSAITVNKNIDSVWSLLQAESNSRPLIIFVLGTDCPSTTEEMANDYLCPEKHIQIKLKITQKGLYKFQLTLGSPSKSLRSFVNLTGPIF